MSPQNAAARPVIAAIHAERSILLAQTSVCGQTGLVQVQLMLTQQMLATASPSFGGVASFAKPVIQMRSSRQSAKRFDLTENALVS